MHLRTVFFSLFSVIWSTTGSNFESLLFIVFINDLCDKIEYSKFANDFNLYRDIKSVEDYKPLQAIIDLVQQWCGENYMEINIHTIELYPSHEKPSVLILITMTVTFQFCLLTV